MDDCGENIFETFESEVRSYCRIFPEIFGRAQGARLYDKKGREYLDFFSAAGALNYGHNEPSIISAVTEYIAKGGVVASLDMFTEAKAAFMSEFASTILLPRGLRYKLQFSGATGANAVEAALKLARKATGRNNVIAFSNGFHGMSLGALAASASARKRKSAGVNLNDVTFFPFDGFLGDDLATDIYAARMLQSGSGVEAPAAFILETVQGEGGLNIAKGSWITAIAKLAREVGALLIVDDIQAGCGRTGTFFSFENLSIEPDIVVLSKSLSGFGTPMSLVLMKPEYDIWSPGEHNGTFRGNNLGFVGATAAVKTFWSTSELTDGIVEKERLVATRLQQIVAALPEGVAQVKGRGLMQGMSFVQAGFGAIVSHKLFQEGVIAETCGPRQEVIKLFPPLNIGMDDLNHGLDALERLVTTLHV